MGLGTYFTSLNLSFLIYQLELKNTHEGYYIMYVRYPLKTQQTFSLSWVFKKLSPALCAYEDENAGSFVRI